MALKRDTRYPGRFSTGNAAHPQGAFKNRTAPGAADGSYLEQDWANDWDGFFAYILTQAGVTANGTVDSGTSSQYATALLSLLLQKGNNLSEIAAAGSTAQAAARTNLSVYSKAEVNAKIIGIGQTWVGYNSTQRVVNTVYTNDTGRPIMVTITSGTAALSRIIVDGVTISNVLVTGASGGNLLTGSVVVPAGSTYQFTSSTAAVAWAELR